MIRGGTWVHATTPVPVSQVSRSRDRSEERSSVRVADYSYHRTALGSDALGASDVGIRN